MTAGFVPGSSGQPVLPHVRHRLAMMISETSFRKSCVFTLWYCLDVCLITVSLFLWNHREIRHIPGFLNFLSIFFRVGQSDQMAEVPSDDIIAAFDRTRKCSCDIREHGAISRATDGFLPVLVISYIYTPFRYRKTPKTWCFRGYIRGANQIWTGDRGVADLCLTTWLWRHALRTVKYNKYVKMKSKKICMLKSQDLHLPEWLLMRCGVLEYLVIRIWRQIVSGVLQSKQAPVLQQGVLRLKRCALIGAASFLARDMAESTSRLYSFRWSSTHSVVRQR